MVDDADAFVQSNLIHAAAFGFVLNVVPQAFVRPFGITGQKQSYTGTKAFGESFAATLYGSRIGVLVWPAQIILG